MVALPKRLDSLEGITNIPGDCGAARVGIRGYVWHADEDCFHRVRLLKLRQSGWLIYDEQSECHRESVPSEAIRVVIPDEQDEPIKIPGRRGRRP